MATWSKDEVKWCTLPPAQFYSLGFCEFATSTAWTRKASGFSCCSTSPMNLLTWGNHIRCMCFSTIWSHIEWHLSHCRLAWWLKLPLFAIWWTFCGSSRLNSKHFVSYTHCKMINPVKLPTILWQLVVMPASVTHVRVELPVDYEEHQWHLCLPRLLWVSL